MRLSVTYSPDLDVTLPDLPRAWGAFEVSAQTLLAPIENEDGTRTTVREATVTLWAPGEYVTPPLLLHYRDAEDELREFAPPQVAVTIVSVLEEGETEKRDLKPQVSLPRPPLWPWIVGAVLLAALTGVLGWLMLTRLRRRMMPAHVPAPAPDPRPAHEIAYSELDRIASLNLPAQAELKQHYTLLANCMRSYVQGRYHIPAMDQTTEELSSAFRRERVDRNHSSLFRQLLSEADLVKFAKFSPSLDQANTAVARARHIVDITKTDDREDHEPAARIPHRAPRTT
jgi:hypothetical protein